MDPDDSRPLTQGADVAPSLTASSSGAAGAPGSEPHGLPSEAEPSFARSGTADPVDDQPVMTAALASLVFTLGLVLLLQVVVHERNAIAAFRPGLAPFLARLCQPLNCVVGPMQRIEAVVIDSSAFMRTDGGTFRLSVTLRNNAALPIAVPAIELTLTDAQDQAVLRRVVLPDELQAAESLAPGADWSAAADVVLSAEIAPVVAGYRMLAFYP